MIPTTTLCFTESGPKWHIVLWDLGVPLLCPPFRAPHGEPRNSQHKSPVSSRTQVVLSSLWLASPSAVRTFQGSPNHPKSSRSLSLVEKCVTRFSLHIYEMYFWFLYIVKWKKNYYFFGAWVSCSRSFILDVKHPLSASRVCPMSRSQKSHLHYLKTPSADCNL